MAPPPMTMLMNEVQAVIKRYQCTNHHGMRRYKRKRRKNVN
jgi:hypothetical protein